MYPCTWHQLISLPLAEFVTEQEQWHEAAGAKQFFCCDFCVGCFMKRPNLSFTQDLVSFALCTFMHGGKRRLGHCVRAAGATGTPQDSNRLG